MMKKIKLFAGSKRAAAGILSAVLILGSGSVLAAETEQGQTSASRSGTAVADAADAEAIAFADAGIDADQVIKVRTEAKWEDGEDVYEVSFSVDGIEYEYLIREEDGEILEWELDGKDVGAVAAELRLKADTGETEAAPVETEALSETETLIGLERAKEITLEDAGANAEDVRFSKIKFEIEKRSTVYEIEFYQGRQEYEYTIDAYSGEILKVERD